MISSITLHNFRNYNFFTFRPSKINIILGPNGCGKTNLLEGLSLTNMHCGFRASSVQELKQNDRNGFEVSVTLDNGNLIAVSYYDNTNKKFLLNGSASKLQDAMRMLRVVYLIPQDEFCLTSGVQTRRKFLDRVTSFFFDEHLAELKKYKELSSERSKVLLLAPEDESWLSGIEDGMSRLAACIATNRTQAINNINRITGTCSTKTLSSKINVSPELSEGWLLYEGVTSIQFERRYREKLKAFRRQDTKVGFATFGVSKFDFEVINPHDGRKHLLFSSGEQKMAIFSIMMACIRHIQSQIQALPSGKNGSMNSALGKGVVFLIDEVTSKLDRQNQEALISTLDELCCQVFLTTTSMPFSSILQTEGPTGEMENQIVKVLDLSAQH